MIWAACRWHLCKWFRDWDMERPSKQHYYEAWTAQTVYEVLTLEMIKLKLETQKLKLEKTKLKVELYNLGYGV